jgi:hypothetical protein
MQARQQPLHLFITATSAFDSDQHPAELEVATRSRPMQQKAAGQFDRGKNH